MSDQDHGHSAAEDLAVHLLRAHAFDGKPRQVAVIHIPTPPQRHNKAFNAEDLWKYKLQSA